MKITLDYFVTHFKAITSSIFALVAIILICIGHYKICKENAEHFKKVLSSQEQTFWTILNCLSKAIHLLFVIFKRLYKYIVTFHVSLTGTNIYLFDKNCTLKLDMYSRMKISLLGIAGLSVPFYISVTVYDIISAWPGKGDSKGIDALVASVILFVIVYICDRTILSYPSCVDNCNIYLLAYKYSPAKGIYEKAHQFIMSIYQRLKLLAKSFLYLLLRLIIAISISSVAIMATYMMSNIDGMIDSVAKSEHQKIAAMNNVHREEELLFIKTYNAYEQYAESYAKQSELAIKIDTLTAEKSKPNIKLREVSCTNHSLLSQLQRDHPDLIGIPVEKKLPESVVIFSEYCTTQKPDKATKDEFTSKRLQEIEKQLAKYNPSFAKAQQDLEKAKEEYAVNEKAIQERDLIKKFADWKIGAVLKENKPQADLAEIKKSTERQYSAGKYMLFAKFLKEKNAEEGNSIFYDFGIFSPVIIILIFFELLPIVSKIILPDSSFDKIQAYQNIVTALPFALDIDAEKISSIHNRINKSMAISPTLVADTQKSLDELNIIQRESEAELTDALTQFKEAFDKYIQVLTCSPGISTAIVALLFSSLAFWFISVLVQWPPKAG